MYFLASKILWAIVQPLNALLILAACGLVLQWTRFKRAGRGVVLASLLAIVGLGALPVGTIMMRALEEAVPSWRDDGKPVAGIIVLGGAMDGDVSLDRGQVALNEAGERILALLQFAIRRPDLPLVFTGGSSAVVGDATSEGDAVRRLQRELGIPDGRLIVEDRSRNTLENARFTHALLKPRPGDRYILVTSAYHMPRSVGLFRSAGFTVLPWPVDFRTTAADTARLSTSLLDGLDRLDTAVREWIGVIAARLLGQTRELLPTP